MNTKVNMRGNNQTVRGTPDGTGARAKRPRQRPGHLRHRQVAAMLISLLLMVAGAANITAMAAVAAPSDTTDGRPTVAVVLGGGAARGFSHIGLLQALEEHGIPVDMLVGTSMGSIVAGLYASGLSTDNLTYLVTQLDMNQFFTPIIPPKGGFVRTDEFEKFLDLLTGHAQLEQLPIPFYSVITNIVTGEEVALNSGPFGRAIVASIAIPGMFPPVEIDGDYYVDGGLLSPVPSAVARDRGADFIIAVDVRRTVTDIDYDSVLNNLQLSLYFLLDKNTDEQLKTADVIVAPQVADNSYMEYDQAEFFIAQGYQAALEAMDDIRAGLLQLDPDFPFNEGPPRAGVDPAEFAQLVDVAAAEATKRIHRSARVHPEVTLRTDARPNYRLDVHVPLGGRDAVFPWFADYTLSGSPGRWNHTIGVGVGDCAMFCLGLFGRPQPDGGGFNAGVMAEGVLGGKEPRSSAAAVWSARYEHTPADSPAQWQLAARVPLTSAVTTIGSEYLFNVGRDARGLFGSPSDDVRATGVYRHYFLGTQKNLWELLRGGTHWYVGGGFSARTGDGHPKIHPVGEVGLLFEGRLFGLYTTRSRVSLTYEGGDNAWIVRLALGN